MRTAILSLGGSMIVPDQINNEFLKAFKDMLLKFTYSGNKAIVVCGGGSTCRKYQASAREFYATKDNLDWIGIATSRLNAELVKSLIGKTACEKIITSPSEVPDCSKNIILSGGFRPGQTTDACAVELAIKSNADIVVNLTDVDYVYDKDPKKHSDATPIKQMSWKQFSEIFGTEHSPGIHAPFGITASQVAAKNNIKVAVVKGKDLDNLLNLLHGKEFVGTIIE